MFLQKKSAGAENTRPPLEQLLSWKDKGYTDIVLFGRMQPFHKGHGTLVETMKASGLRVNIVFNDKADGCEGERNPFNSYQRQTMAMLAKPWLQPQDLSDVNVYLGGGGDVGNAVRRLTHKFNQIAPPGKLVFGYFEKAEDRKEYLVDGQTIKGAHYVELVGQPRGPIPIQRITEDMIKAVTGEYMPIDAKMFRKAHMSENADRCGDEIAYELLEPAVADFVFRELQRAKEMNVPVGLLPPEDMTPMQMAASM